jgi:hypothetical protein
MLKIIIMIAIFYAGYQIGMNGFDQFMSSIDIDRIVNSVSDMIAWVDKIVEKMRG